MNTSQNQDKLVKFISIIFIIIALANFVLFVFGKLDEMVFWIIIIVCGLAAYIIKKIK